VQENFGAAFAALKVQLERASKIVDSVKLPAVRRGKVGPEVQAWTEAQHGARAAAAGTSQREHISIPSIPQRRKEGILTVAMVEKVKTVGATQVEQLEHLITISFFCMRIRKTNK